MHGDILCAGKVEAGKRIQGNRNTRRHTQMQGAPRLRCQNSATFGSLQIQMLGPVQGF